MRQHRLGRILEEKLVMIIRVKNPDDIDAIVECFDLAGVRVLEITSNTPKYCDAIRRLKKAYPHLLIGAGTVTNASLAHEAIEAGAEFLVTPNTSEEIVSVAHQHEVPVLMGAFSPTEIVTAVEAGADIVKLFPAGSLGTEYLESLAKGPLNDVIFMPVGGVSDDNFKSWFDAGGKGVGIGGSLAQPVRSEEQKQALVQRLKAVVEQLHTKERY
ncbi:bifunctional 4-hydroxy-2-oxoglutarate aldolase/2-dehydro-3-deoxy-phosphogluconate aldolase [Echinimonas agarilytica]|uniref:Bifunctional 4-hydroxy-2-oxoglutarate aldolase/2-dehydro-3-deoxy-phosphogluconate aldolase n=1 Tax=Echinimonas agarilytica TaxID=1215918 RepID=A0AA41W701_9GAMM|nr:bifunctional 4-hydroxy-2-oxoglutarate aldolase/2-dehydro-3-deoxy-phosphogluconate aldolase [Echinimonas agarilytica]MCM2680195.1 bifunctional 4-hydroxy-2-oxoglutarate aldolase/2-dehydro-3-deoxy-phosphogluconate aldolase [Echinimonas agarilytica]